MQGALGLFDADQLRALVERDEHPEHPQRPVRDVVGEEAPGVTVTTNLLTKLERQLGAHGSRFHADRSRNDLREIRADARRALGRLGPEVRQDAGDVPAVRLEQFAGIGRLEFANLPGFEVVEAHSGERFIDWAERRVPGDQHQEQPIAAGPGRMRKRGGDDSFVLDVEEIPPLRVGRVDHALFLPHGVAALWPGADLDGVPTRRFGKPEVQPNAEVIRVAPRPPADFIDPAALA